MMTWATLSTEYDAGEAAHKFMLICHELNLNHEIVALMCEELEAIQPKDAYINLIDPPSLNGLKIFLGNVQEWVEEATYEQFSAEITKQESQIEHTPPPENLEISANTHANTYDIAILTLINIMAGCSKVGMGSEESVGMIEDAPELASALFEDKDFVKRVKLIWQIAKKHSDEYALMVPFMFAFAVLLNLQNKQLMEKLKPQLLFLPTTITAFQGILENKFNHCLTTAAMYAKNAYNTYFYAETEQSEGNLECFASEVPERINQLIISVRTHVQTAIQNRIENNDTANLNVAINWNMDRPPSRNLRSPSSAESPRTCSRGTPQSIVSPHGLFSSLSSSSDGRSRSSTNASPFIPVTPPPVAPKKIG